MISSQLDRRCFLHTLWGTAAALAPIDRCWSSSAPSEFPLHAGVGVADITPPLEVGLLMSSSAGRWEPFEGVRLPLHAKAVVLESGPCRVALVALDLIGLAGDAVGGFASFKDKVASAAGRVVGPENMILACSHTHTAPESIALTDLDQTDPFQDWLNHLIDQIGGAIRTAAQSTRPCRLSTGTCVAPGLAVNRRIKTTRGITSVRRQVPPEQRIGPEGPADDLVRVGALVDRSNRPLAILVGFTSHPVIEMCIKQVSPDYPGEMSLELERRHPGATALFLQGACGNINPPTMDRSADNARRYGRRLAEVVDQALADLRRVEGDELAVAWTSADLPFRNLEGQLESDPLTVRIGSLRVGQAAWVFVPGEPFVEIALAIQEASPFASTTVVGYAEDYIGYIPTDRAFENGGYEIGPGRWSRVARGSQSIVCREGIRMLKSLHEAPGGSPRR